MPELPEVEVLARHLGPLLVNRRVVGVEVRRAKVLGSTSPRQLAHALRGATFLKLTRRGKYLLFTLQPAKPTEPIQIAGHLGMTGRMYLTSKASPLPKHAAVVLHLDRNLFVFEDTRYFGKFTLDLSSIQNLGPEPLDGEFTIETFAQALKRSAQAIKIKLLDQSLVAGVGNIYASEALFRAGILPSLSARRLTRAQVARLWQAIRDVLAEAIACGSTVPLNYSGTGKRDGLFYFGLAPEGPEYYTERLRVYDRAGQPCAVCGTNIQRRVQAGRSTFFCAYCQRRRPAFPKPR